MDKWQTAEWLGFIAIVVAVLFGIGAIWAARRFGTRRGKLLVVGSSTPLLRTVGSQSSHLQVTFKGLPVEDPHLMRFYLKNVGPHDITREQFDDGKLFIGLNSQLYGVVSVASSDGVDPHIQELATKEIAVAATLLPKGTAWVFEFMVSGPGQPKLRSRLINTDVVEGETTSAGFLQATSSGFLWFLDSVAAALGAPVLGRKR